MTAIYPKQYRKRPVVIDAIQWNGHADDALHVIAWILGSGGNAKYHAPRYVSESRPDEPEWIELVTLEDKSDSGGHRVSPGDYVIKGVQGEFYPCKPDIFADTYEEVL